MQAALTFICCILSISFAFSEINSNVSDSPLEFDARLVAPCSEVTASNVESETRIVEAKLPISANFRCPEGQFDQLVYTITLPESLTIADFLPKTEMGSDAGTIVIQESASESERSGNSVRGEVRVGYQFLGAGAGAAQENSSGRAKQSTIQRSMLAPKQVLLAAGTQRRASQLYFKLQPNSQTSLEGERSFGLLLVVPKSWKAGCIKLECRGRVKATQKEAVVQNFGIGLYLPGIAKAELTELEKLAKSSEKLVCDQSAFVVEKLKEVDPYDSLLGSWKSQANNSVILTFEKNGKSSEKILGGRIMSGTYKRRDAKSFDWEIEGILWGTNKCIANWDLEDSILTIVINGVTLKYERILD